MSKKLNRPVIFTEMGYRSIDDPLTRPWDYRDKAQKYIQKYKRWPLRLYYLSLCLNLGGRADLYGNGFLITIQLEEKIIWDLRHKIN